MVRYRTFQLRFPWASLADLAAFRACARLFPPLVERALVGATRAEVLLLVCTSSNGRGGNACAHLICPEPEWRLLATCELPATFGGAFSVAHFFGPASAVVVTDKESEAPCAVEIRRVEQSFRFRVNSGLLTVAGPPDGGNDGEPAARGGDRDDAEERRKFSGQALANDGLALLNHDGTVRFLRGALERIPLPPEEPPVVELSTQ